MAIKDVVKISRKTFFDPRAWLGYDILKQLSLALWRLVKPVFTLTPPAEGTQESFAEVVKRLNLTQEDLDVRRKGYLIFSSLLIIAALGIFILGIYFLIKGFFIDFIIALAVAVFLGAQSFRFHFWYFQIKHRKLGCSFEEWLQGFKTLR